MHISTMRPCFLPLMFRRGGYAVLSDSCFSCGMLPSLTQGNSHSVLPLRGFLWRLPHTFSAGISWWLRKNTPSALPVLPPLPGRFRLAVPVFPCYLFRLLWASRRSDSSGVKASPSFWAAASSLSVLVFGCPAFCLSRHALCCAAFSGGVPQAVLFLPA